jgi:hypothetical protein
MAFPEGSLNAGLDLKISHGEGRSGNPLLHMQRRWGVLLIVKLLSILVWY